jgi:hypothetical protein
VLVPSEHSLSELRYDRLVGEEARQLYGNLAPMPADWPFRAQIERIASEFISALRSSDRQALLALHDNQIDSGELGYLLEDRDSPFAQLRQRAPSQTALFVGMAPDGSLLDRDEPDATICFCRAGDCSNKWPIARFDAENAPERPFACIRVVPRDWVTRGFGLDRPSRGGWLYEPAETAFRG